MFHSSYQDGDCVEVFSPAGKNPGSEWKLSGKVDRLYEKGVKGYVLTVSGGATSKMQLPKAPKGLLGLRQRYLVLQVLTAASQDRPFSLELALKDSGGARRRLVLSSSFRSLHCTPLHAQVPLVGLDRHRGTWANLSIDMAGLVAVCFRADAFRTLELVAIGPTCRLRKIFTMKQGLEDDSDDGTGKEDQDETADHAAPGPDDCGGCEPAPVGPVPVRMAFPAGVVPAPKNWVISASTLRRLTCRDVPPPSPSGRGYSKTASSSGRGAGTGRKPRPASSARPSSFERGPSSRLSSTAVSPSTPREERSGRSSRSGTAETPRRLLEISASKPSSRSSSSRSSPTDAPLRQHPLSSRGSNGSSTRPPATPSPFSTPARSGTNATGRRGSHAPPSSSPGALGLSTPGKGSSSSGGPGAGLSSTRGAGVLSNSGANGTPPLRRRSLQATRAITAAAAAAATPCTAGGSFASTPDETSFDGVADSRKRGMLPARRRASAAYLSGGGTDEAGRTAAAGGGSCGEEGRGGRTSLAPAGEWRVAGGWSEGKETPAPAWSFLANENDRRVPDDVSRSTATKPKRLYSFESPPASPPTHLKALTPSCSRDRRALASVADGGAHGSAPAPADDDTRGRDAAEEATLPAEIDVSWREGRYGEGGDGAGASTAGASARSFSRTTRLRSPEVKTDTKRTSSRSRPLSSTPTTHATSTSAAGTPGAVGVPCRSCPADAALGQKEDSVAAKATETAARLFSSPLSAIGERNRAAPRSSANLAGDASGLGGTKRSPMSARVDVLQNLLGPVGEQDPAQRNGRDNTPSGARELSSRDRANVAKRSTVAVTERKDGVGGGGYSSVAERDDNADTTDALERLVGLTSAREDPKTTTITNNTASTASTAASPTNRDDDGSPNTNTISGFAGAVARRARSRPRLSLTVDGGDLRQDEDTDRPRTTGSKGVALRPTQTSSLDGGHEPGGKATPLSIASDGGATARMKFGGRRSSGNGGREGLLRSSSPSYSHGARSEERWDVKKADQRPVLGERYDELEELERKEIALLDLEESYHSEFGSVVLSQSPENHEPFGNNSSPSWAVVAPLQGASLKAPNILRSSEGPSVPPPSPKRHQRGRGFDANNVEDDTDSVVLGSRDSTASAAPGEESAGEGIGGGGAGRPAEGGKREARDRGGGDRHEDGEGGSSDLYFDPVLNCYYDREADKYYGLR